MDNYNGSKAPHFEGHAPRSYVDPNFSEPPKWTVEVNLIEWRHLPSLQKNLMIQERLVNARTIEELNLAYTVKKIENNLNQLKNQASYDSSNKSMR